MSGMLSDSFPIGNGTCQRCLLSPLLFALVLEPLHRIIRNNKDITGVHIGSSKLPAYANDLLFYLTQPQTSLPILMEKIHKFGFLSNFKMNYNKLELLPIHVPLSMWATLRQSFQFIWQEVSLPYLGTHISSDPKLLYHLNYGTLLGGILRYLKQWKGYSLTWFGRVKITILPSIIYLLYTVPLPWAFFRQLRRAFITIIWQGKRS